MILLLSSYVFYGFLFKPLLWVVLTAVIFMTFWIGKLIDRSEDRSLRQMFLWIGVILNIALLIYFKYLPFLAQNLNLLMRSLGLTVFFDTPAPLVSIGLSFFIFQAISYLADIYFRIVKPEPHFGYFALFLSFFPKLLQGPIERAGNLLPQLKAQYEFNHDNMRFGMLLFAWGLFKKVVIADRLGFYVDAVYNNVHGYTGFPLLLATYAYAFQIYMDFSGYTDMALGTARLFNINLTQNFNSPYSAISVADFWRRWHISFSTWLRDYLFEPLQMQWRNWGLWGTATALMVTFLIAGIWHGASWGFVIFGLLHGLYLAGSVLYRPFQKKLYQSLGVGKTWSLKVWQIFATFNLVCFAWIFFRANSLSDAFYVLNNFLKGSTGVTALFENAGLLENLELCITLSILIIASLVKRRIGSAKAFSDLPRLFRWAIYVLLPLIILGFYINKNTTFTYFNF